MVPLAGVAALGLDVRTADGLVPKAGGGAVVVDADETGDARRGDAAPGRAPVGGVGAGLMTAVARGGRRRRNALGGARTGRVVVKLTAEEKALVEAMAASQGVTPPALFMRALVTGGTEAAAKYQRLRDELTAARRLLAAVSNNINQLARHSNAAAADPEIEPVPAEQVQAALVALERAMTRIEAVTGAVHHASGDPVAGEVPVPAAAAPTSSSMSASTSARPTGSVSRWIRTP